MTLESRLDEANRLRPIFERAVSELERFLSSVTKGYIKKPIVVNRFGHEAIRFADPSATDAILLKFARVVSLNRAMLLLMDNGFVQEQCIVQRSLEETNEDILFYAISETEAVRSDRFRKHLEEFWKEDYKNPNDPVGTRVRRGFTRKGIGPFLNRIFGQPNPSLADDVHHAIFSMYSGFTHGAAPQIFELYDFEKNTFHTNGLLGTNRHIDYVIDGANSVYRSIQSACCLSKAFGSNKLLATALEIERSFVQGVGVEKLIKETTKEYL